ncbi:MAG: tetratricopeptide repeat protein [Abditibacteriaceae bacterium]
MKKHLLFALPFACPLLLGGNVLAQTATPILPGNGAKDSLTAPPPKPPLPKASKTDTGTAPTSSVSSIQQATDAYNAGIKSLAKNDLNGAAANFEKATQLTPNDANANLYLGYVRLKQNNWSEAVTSLEKSKANINSLEDTLKPILWNDLGLAYAKTNRQEDALNAYSQALKLDKNYVDAKYNLAFAQLTKKDYKNALANLQDLRSANSNDTTFQITIYNGIATAYEGLGDWGSALGAYSKVVQLNGNDVDGRFNFAFALKKAGRSKDAIDQLQTLIKMRPNYAPALSLLGDVYLSQHQWSDAAKVLDQYTKTAPNDFNAWFNLGVAYDHTSNFDNALRAYNKAEALNLKDPAVKNNIGRIYFKRGVYDDAVENLQAALNLNPAFDDARLNLGLVLMAQEKWKEAAEQWKTYLLILRDQLQAPGVTATDKVAISKRGLDAHSALALCYMHVEMYADARDQYKKLLTEQPKNEDAKVNLALCYYHTRNYTDSVKLNREIIVANPKNAIAYNNLGVALEGMNRIGEAMDNYQKAVNLNPNYSDAKNNLARLNAKTATS